MDDDRLIEMAILAILEDDDDDDDENAIQRVYVDLEGWRRLEGAAFSQHFRMSRPTSQLLLLAVGNHLRNRGALRKMTTPLDVSLLYTLWVLANPDTFRSAGSQFGKAPSTVFHHYSAIIKALSEMSDQYIKWPCAAERAIIRREFEQTYRYPGVVGAIDGTYCTVTAPLEQKPAYITRHHTHALIAQAVCDHNLLYRDVFLGMPGRVGDLRTFEESPLYETLLRNPDVMNDDEHLLGDGAYPISKHILRPYIDNGHLTRVQKTHNYELSRVRAGVERSFALLFGKNQRLKYHRTYNLDITLDHEMASFVVHNFRIIHEVLDDVQLALFHRAQPLNHERLLDQPEAELIEESRLIGALKREYIAALFQED